MRNGMSYFVSIPVVASGMFYAGSSSEEGNYACFIWLSSRPTRVFQPFSRIRRARKNIGGITGAKSDDRGPGGCHRLLHESFEPQEHLGGDRVLLRPRRALAGRRPDEPCVTAVAP